MTDQYQDVCDCGRLQKPAGTPHEPWCAFLRPPRPSERHRPSTADVLREITGGGTPCPACGATSGCLHGIPAVIDERFEEPLTHRVGDYMGQPRELKTSIEPPCQTFSASEHDATECKHCGWTEETHIVVLGLPAVVHTTPIEALLPPAIDAIVARDLAARRRGRGPDGAPTEPDAAWSAYGALLDAVMDLRRWLQTRGDK